MLSNDVKHVIDRAKEIAKDLGHSSYGVVHLAKALSENETFRSAMKTVHGDISDMSVLLDAKLRMYEEDKSPSAEGADAYANRMTRILLNRAIMQIYSNSGNAGIVHLYLVVYGEYEPFMGQDVLNSVHVSKDSLYQALYDIEKDVLRLKKEDRDQIVDFMIDPVTMRETFKKRAVGNDKNIREGLERKRAMAMAGAQSIPEGKWQDYVTNLNQKMAGETKPLIGRESEIARIEEILMKKNKANPIEIGEAGVGKTAVINEFARLINAGKVPTPLLDKIVFELNTTALMAGTIYRGMLEDRFNAVINALKDMNGRAILYIDEIHMLMGAGAGEGTMDIANMLKTALVEGNIKFIGSTTYDEYRKFISRDPAFQRRFNKVDINEPSVAEAKEIIRGLKTYFEEFHKITYDEKALDAAVDLTNRFIHDRYLPDKAIDLVDEAGAWLHLHAEAGTTVTEEMINNALSKSCNISSKTINADSLSELKALPSELRAKVFGQPEAINQVSKAIQIAKSGLGDETKPVGAFLFVGPSGVGKTELAKQLANELGIKLVRFDMSEYHDSYSVSKLFGSDAGLVGYENGGLLTNAVAKTPECVLLLDEVEKAHPDVFKSFLQVLDYGVLTDNHGKQVDFKNTIIIMTSNVGVADLDKRPIGFGPTENRNNSIIDAAVNSFFTVEFRNRLTGIIKFNSLSAEAAMAVVNKELDILRDKAAKRGYAVTFDKDCKNQILKEGVSREFGARQVQRVIAEKVKATVVSAMLDDTLAENTVITYRGGKFEALSVEVEKEACV